jgi:hypothetical protein
VTWLNFSHQILNKALERLTHHTTPLLNCYCTKNPLSKMTTWLSTSAVLELVDCTWAHVIYRQINRSLYAVMGHKSRKPRCRSPRVPSPPSSIQIRLPSAHCFPFVSGSPPPLAPPADRSWLRRRPHRTTSSSPACPPPQPPTARDGRSTPSHP